MLALILNSIIVAIFCVFLLIGLIRKAVALRLVAIPNHRSSHIAPTPTGGGIAVYFSLLLMLFLTALFEELNYLWLQLVAAAFPLFVLGVMDDVFEVRAASKLLIQVLVSAISLGLLFHFNGLMAPLSTAISLWLSLPLLLLLMVWWINLFNFMDGIDGIAAMQAIFLLLASAGISMSEDASSDHLFYGWGFVLLVVILVVFLVFNFQRALIFLGDSGSLFVAFLIMMIVLMGLGQQQSGIFAWLILTATFMSDALVTLVRRYMCGASVMQAHREHLYQRLARQWQSHNKVVALYFLINVAWCFPIAYYAAASTIKAAALYTIMAYLPLLYSAYKFGAGVKAQ